MKITVNKRSVWGGVSTPPPPVYLLCILYKVLNWCRLYSQLVIFNFTTKTDESRFYFFFPHKPRQFCEDLERDEGEGGGGDWKGRSLYSVVELLKQRAGRNCCSSVCAACVYERGFYFYFFVLITRMDNDHLWG